MQTTFTIDKAFAKELRESMPANLQENLRKNLKPAVAKREKMTRKEKWQSLPIETRIEILRQVWEQEQDYLPHTDSGVVEFALDNVRF